MQISQSNMGQHVEEANGLFNKLSVGQLFRNDRSFLRSFPSGFRNLVGRLLGPVSVTPTRRIKLTLWIRGMIGQREWTSIPSFCLVVVCSFCPHYACRRQLFAGID